MTETTAESHGVSELEAAAWLLVPIGLVALALRLGVAARPDWLGHLLAGFGASLLLVLAALRCTGGRRGTVLGATALAALLGWGAEHTMFALAGADPMDLHAQTLGAGLAGLALLRGRAEETPALPCSLVAASCLVAGAFFAFLA